MGHAVELDRGAYEGTYKLIAGRAALDFVNLVSYRGSDREHDWLEPASNALRWAVAVGLPAPSSASLDQLRDLRKMLARVFLAIARHETPQEQDVAAIGDIAARSFAGRRLELPAGAAAARWVDQQPSLVAELARDAVALLTSPEALGRLSSCPACGWVFLDASRNRSRRWCDPGDCGNRARQRRHYARRQQR